MAVSTYEANGCIFASAFAFGCGWLGWKTLGLLGAVVGVPLGCFVGWFAGWFLVEASSLHSIWMELRSRRRALRPHFGEFWKADRQAEWDRAVENLRLGRALTGRVVAQFYYGVALDVGIGFPALLTKMEFAEPFSENPPLGSEVTARIDQMKAADREIHLTQRASRAEAPAKLPNGF
ncbi:MAG TPA: hypothetical protein VGN57_19755 [Pirellulaceae bacterium]|jgi:hypothetical protein|nr:hypothetical protein [Pirellulaceae bacterium]